MKFLSCRFNIDTACVELRYTDGRGVSIYTPAVEDEYAENMYQRSELDWLIDHDPAGVCTAGAARERGGIFEKRDWL